jgi:ACT domain-containing protein
VCSSDLVLHSRGRRDVVEVNIIFNVGDQVTLSRILEALRKAKIKVWDVRIEGRRYYSKTSLSFILLGHVIDQDIQDTIDRINKTGLVQDVDVRMTDPEKESSVLMNVDVDEDKVVELMDCIHGICRRKGFLFIREVSL